MGDIYKMSIKTLIAGSAVGIGGVLAVTASASALTVNTANIANGAVTTAKIANNAITTAKLASNAVHTNNIVNGGVTSDDISNGTIRSVDLGDGAVTSAKLGSNLTLNGTTTLSDGVSTLQSNVATGTLLTSVKLTPKASATAAGVTRHTLVAVGDVTGTTAQGFGDPAVATYGLQADFGRTVAATGAFSGTDTSLDVRAVNYLNNSGGNYQLQGAYIKAKNYSTGTVKNLNGLVVEVANDGTVSGTSYGIKIASTGTNPITADLLLSSGVVVLTGAAAPSNGTCNTATVPNGSMYLNRGATSAVTVFYVCWSATANGNWTAK